MCTRGCLERVTEWRSQHDFPAGVTGGLEGRPGPGAALPASRPGFSRVVDLTHPLPPDFPTYLGEPGLSVEVLREYGRDGFNIQRWLVQEHVGTHIDAPIHFAAEGRTADEIPVESLVVPLAVLDIRARVQDDPDAEVTPEDIRAWEAAHGPLPVGCCVAMDGGWDRFARDARFRGADERGTLHFPGFHVETARMLLEERDVVGLAVDTLSIDYGPSTDYPTHHAWLPAGRWAAEGLANLSALPPVGATLVVGGPTIKGATGGPSRIIALL
jgi:kynurenine formamidase